MRRLITCLALSCSPLAIAQDVDPQCAAHGGNSAAEQAFVADIFALTDGQIYGWKQDISLGLYGYGPFTASAAFEDTVRAFREVTGLDMGWTSLGGQTNVAIIYSSYRTLTFDPGLAELVESLGGEAADLFSPTGALARDEDGYHYHFRLDTGGEEIAVAAVFIDSQRFTETQAQGLIPKALSDSLIIGGGSEALSPSLRQSPAAVLAHFESCGDMPLADLNLYDQIYQPRVVPLATSIESGLNDNPLDLMVEP